jgi:hypothetical protein
MSNRHRPMTREELESLRPIKATKENPYLQSKRVFEGAYVYAPAGTEFTSKVSRQRIGERADGQILCSADSAADPVCLNREHLTSEHLSI